MARRLIGLDIGTNAVRVAEIEPGDPPRVTSFGQVALPFDAMREGEVVDPAAVTAAIQRLWKELSLRKGDVRVGVASPRVLVRTVDLPAMSDEDLAGALRFQAQELIPIPLEEAVLDFQPIESLAPPPPVPDAPPGEPMTRVLLAAAHRETVDNLVRAVRAAGLGVAAVDLVPLALIRAIGRRVSDNGTGAEAIVSIGGGVTVVTVHEAGLARFVRILGAAGRGLTDAIARDLGVPVDRAEALKRQIDQAPEDLVTRSQAAMARPLGDLCEQIRGSLDYYRTQPGVARLLRVTVTGGGALTPGLPDRLRELVGVPVELAAPREHLAVADIGFPEDQLDALDPFLPVPAGLALGGLAAGRRINLLSAPGRSPLDRKRVIVAAGVGAGVLLLGLGLATVARQGSLDSEEGKLSDAKAQTSRLQARVASLRDAQKTQTQVETLKAQVQSVLANDVSWARMLQEISRTIPNDTWLTAFQGTATAASRTGTPGAPAPTAPIAPSSSSSSTSTTVAGGAAAGSTSTTAAGAPGTAAAATAGTVSFTAVGLDFTSVAAWIQRIGTQIPSFANLWVPSASRGGTAGSSGSSGSITSTTSGGRELVNFSSTATITAAARSDRLETFNRELR